MHEYKRQLLNVMNIIALYSDLLENPDMDIVPQTFIFGAKAASGYLMAKQVIKLICYLAEDIKKHPKINEKLNVVYMEDYNVTMAEKLMPASEVSEQISQAGKEASGTGNMKFMINGAITIGTLDGANVEMSEAVGMKIFSSSVSLRMRWRIFGRKGITPAVITTTTTVCAGSSSLSSGGITENPSRIWQTIC